MFRNFNDLDLYKTDYVLKLAANSLSDSGDTFLSCISENQEISNEFIVKLLNMVQPETSIDKKCDTLQTYLNGEKPLTKIEELLLHYYISGYYFWRTLEFREVYLQYSKILHVFNSYKRLNELNKDGKLIDLIKVLCRFALHGIFKTYDEINYLEYYDLNTFFKKFEKNELIIKTNTTLSFEINEIIYLYNRINQKLKLIEFNNYHYIIFLDLCELILEIKENDKEYTDENINISNKIRLIFKKLKRFNGKNILVDIESSEFIITSIINLKIGLLELERVFSDIITENCFSKENKKNVKNNLEGLEKIIKSVLNNTEISQSVVDQINYLKDFSRNLNTNENKTVNSMNNRILELELKSRTNYYLYMLNLLSIYKYSNVDDYEFRQLQQYLIDLVSDSIFCLYEIIRIHLVYGISYVKNHSSLAYYYEKMGDWCNRKENLYKKCKLSMDECNLRFENNLKELINEDNLKILNTNYNYQKALNHYKLALETHKQGSSYKSIMEEIYVMNDDLNENLMHFFCALERYKINSNSILSRIQELMLYSHSYVEYNIDNYIYSNR